MAGLDNWSWLVPVWLRPITSLNACVFRFYGFCQTPGLHCSPKEAQWRPGAGSCEVHTVCCSVPESFLVAMLDSPSCSLSFSLLDTHTVFFHQRLIHNCPAPDIIQKQTRTPCSLFHISQLLCLHLCVCVVCVRLGLLAMFLNVQKCAKTRDRVASVDMGGGVVIADCIN